MSAPPPVTATASTVWRRWRPVALFVLSIAVAWLVFQFIDRIQWSAVGDAIGQLHWWQGGALIALLLVRQLFNATPIARFIPGIGVGRAMQNDMAANLVATAAPPPGDVVMRVAMFRSWGINPVDGMAGVMLTMIVFYGARFTAPVLGLALIAIQGAERGQWVTGLVSAAIAVTIILGLLLVLRSDAWAAVVGRTAARVVGRLRASVDADAWADAVVDFRGKIATTLRSNLLPAMLGMLAAIVVDGLILLTSLRFVGLPADALSTIDILGAFLMVYPLTILPLFGLGVIDALLIAGWTEVAGAVYEEPIVAATIVWRTVTLGGTLGLGAVCVALWKARTHGADASTSSAPDPSLD